MNLLNAIRNNASANLTPLAPAGPNKVLEKTARVASGGAVLNTADSGAVLRGKKDSLMDALGGYVATSAKTKKQAEALRPALAEVDLQIKQIMGQIEAKRDEEQAVKDAVEDSQDQAGRMTENLNKAADAYRDMLGATDILP